MKSKINKQDILSYIGITLIILSIIAVVAYAILCAWVFFTYADTPVTELPAWVWWVMHSGGSK